MTHDELLVRVKLWDDYAKGGYTPAVFQAIRAVVELHKPEWILLQIVLKGTKPDPVAICSHCSDEQWRKSYPCQTIKAIEKELK